MVIKILKQKLLLYRLILIFYLLAITSYLAMVFFFHFRSGWQEFEKLFYQIASGGLGYSPCIFLVDKIFSLKREIAEMKEKGGGGIIITG